jgi:alpha-beta hydrolase superfamily lysophospholipase
MRNFRSQIGIPGRRLIAPAALLLSLGACVKVDTTLRDRAVPIGLGALDRHVANDAILPGVIPNTEKRLKYHDPASPAKTEFAVVYLHGFSATRQDTAPLAGRVAEALAGNLFETRFAGHGSSDPQAMLEGSVHAWVNDTAEAIEIGRQLGEQVIVIGTSTGATLATVLFDRHPAMKKHVAAMVFISPNFGVHERAMNLLLWPGGNAIAKLLHGDTYGWEPESEIRARYWTERYPTEVGGFAIATARLGRRADLGELKMPLIMFYSDEDQVVDPTKSVAAFERFGAPADAKRRIQVKTEGESQHNLVGDILSPSTTEGVKAQIIEFLKAQGLR